MSNQEKGNELPEFEKDLQERIDGLNAELKPLLGKFELGISAEIQIMRDGIIARTVLISTRKDPNAVAQSEPSELAKPE